jgi:transposase
LAAVTHLHFTPAEVDRLRFERFPHPHPLVQRKMEALLLKSEGLPHQQIARIVGVCENTLLSYFAQYQSGGVEALQVLNFYQPESRLEDHRSSLEAHFQDHPPASVKEAAAVIEARTGIRRSLSPVRQFLQRLGLRRRKVGSVPAQADWAEQEAFQTQMLEPRLQEARAGKRIVFFVDAAHFVFAPFLGFWWSCTRLFVKAPSGRQRFHVLGALNAITHKLVTVTNMTYIHAASVCELLEKLARRVRRPITVVLDHARYQKCQPVRDLAQRLGLELLYLPAYSPNLNLMERLWKFVQKKCLYNRYYGDFAAFRQAIQALLRTLGRRHASELRSLITLHFQTFREQEVLLAA